METTRALVCDIEIPDDLQERRRLSGQFVDDESLRRYPRKACQANAAFRARKTLPAIRREPIWSRIVLQDISRCGAGFLHSEQLFPDEEALVVFPNGSQRIVRVMRCRRLGPKCFEVGCQFTTNSENSNSEQAD